MQIAVVDGVRREAVTSGEPGICPGCGTPVIGKCGEILVNHWAHRAGGECDRWSEPESEWHRRMKAAFAGGDLARMEVRITDPATGKRHRADAVSSDGWVVEVQKSPISPAEMREREAFYLAHSPGKGMVWVFPPDIGEKDHRLRSAQVPVLLIRPGPHFPDEVTVLHAGKAWQAERKNDLELVWAVDFMEREGIAAYIARAQTAWDEKDAALAEAKAAWDAKADAQVAAIAAAKALQLNVQLSHLGTPAKVRWADVDWQKAIAECANRISGRNNATAAEVQEARDFLVFHGFAMHPTEASK